jgi:hypothetical protein
MEWNRARKFHRTVCHTSECHAKIKTKGSSVKLEQPLQTILSSKNPGKLTLHKNEKQKSIGVKSHEMLL